MKVILIYPDILSENWPGIFYHGVGYLSTVLKKAGHDVSLLHITSTPDRNQYLYLLRKSLNGENRHLIAFSATTNMFPYVQEWARWAKQEIPNVFNICGGVHATLNPQDTIETDGLDCICIGEGEDALVELCNKMETGQDISKIQNLWLKEEQIIHKNPMRPLISPLDRLPFPDRNIFNYGQLYHEKQGTAIVMASRGCPYNCSYCCNHALRKSYGGLGSYVRFRSVSHLIEELKEIRGNYPFVKKFSFDDDILPLYHEWFERFVCEYKKVIGIPFACNIYPSLINRDVVRLLKEAGCWEIHIGIESGNDRIRNEVLGRNVSVEQIHHAFSLCKEAGIRLYSFNMVGLPSETMRQSLETVKLNALIGIDTPQVSIFYPYKGTKLYDICRDKGLLTDKFVKSYFDDSTLHFDKLRRKQILFCMLYFRELIKVYHQLHRMKGLLSKIGIRLLDKLLCSRIWFEAIWSTLSLPNTIDPNLKPHPQLVKISKPVRYAIVRIGQMFCGLFVRKLG